MSSPALTQYLCPNPVQFNEKVASSPTAGGWIGDNRLESYYLDASDHPFIKNGVMYCVYVPGWLQGIAPSGVVPASAGGQRHVLRAAGLQGLRVQAV